MSTASCTPSEMVGDEAPLAMHERTFDSVVLAVTPKPESAMAPPRIPPTTDSAVASASASALASTTVPRGKKVKGPIVARHIMQGGAILELDKESKEFAIARGLTVIDINDDGTFPPVVVAPPELKPRRIHRKKLPATLEPGASTEQVVAAVAAAKAPAKKQSSIARAVVVGVEVSGPSGAVSGPSGPSGVTSGAVSGALLPAKKLASGGLLCPQCIRAISLVHRLNAAVEGYRTTCDAVIEKLPAGSEARQQAVEMAASASTTARHAVADSQYVLRNLVCSKSCIQSTPTVTHATDVLHSPPSTLLP